MCDIGENHPVAARNLPRLWELIDATRSLDWLLLTKRPHRFRAILPETWGQGWPHVRLMATTESQEWANTRVPQLLKVPSYGGYGLSCGPVLGPIDLYECGAFVEDWEGDPEAAEGFRPFALIDWIIGEGESGCHARKSEAAWFRRLRDQCSEVDVAFNLKQWGEWCPYDQLPESARAGLDVPLDAGKFVRLGTKHTGRLLDGELWDEFPEAA